MRLRRTYVVTYRVLPPGHEWSPGRLDRQLQPYEVFTEEFPLNRQAVEFRQLCEDAGHYAEKVEPKNTIRDAPAPPGRGSRDGGAP